MRKYLPIAALLLALLASLAHADHFSHSVNVSALDFGDTSDDFYVEVPHDASLNTGTTITVEAWVFPRDDGTGQAIVAKLDGGFAAGWEVDNSSGSFRVTLRDSVVDSFGGALPLNEWVHLAFTYDGTTLTLYMNGALVNSTTGTSSVDSSAVLQVGRRPAGTSALFDGRVDEVRIWDAARTQAQIQSTMDKQLIGNESGLVGYWKLNEDGGSTAMDDSTNSNDGTITGATYITEDIPHLTDSQFHNLSPEDEVQPTAGEIPAMEQRDTDERQRSLPLMGRIGDVEDSTGYPLVRLTLALMAGGFILFGAWFFSQLAPENPVVAWVFILIASLLAFGFGAIGWVSFVAIALYSSGIVAFRQSTPA